MWTAMLILCAVAADAAPLAAKSVTTAAPELSAIATPESATSQSVTSPGASSADVVTSTVAKATKSKKFHPSEMDLHDGKKPLASVAKLAVAAAVPTPEPSIDTPVPTTAPLAAAEDSSPLPEREAELLKAHIAPPFVSTTLFEDEKAGRYQHSALFGYSSFF